MLAHSLGSQFPRHPACIEVILMKTIPSSVSRDFKHEEQLASPSLLKEGGVCSRFQGQESQNQRLFHAIKIELLIKVKLSE